MAGTSPVRSPLAQKRKSKQSPLMVAASPTRRKSGCTSSKSLDKYKNRNGKLWRHKLYMDVYTGKLNKTPGGLEKKDIIIVDGIAKSKKQVLQGRKRDVSHLKKYQFGHQKSPGKM